MWSFVYISIQEGEVVLCLYLHGKLDGVDVEEEKDVTNFLWSTGPDHENVISMSEPAVRLVCCPAECIFFCPS